MDIHHRPKNVAELIRYLPEPWQDYANQWATLSGVDPRLGSGFPLVNPPNSIASPFLDGAAGRRLDSFPEDGTLPGSNYELTRDQLLDRFNIFRGILTHDIGEYGNHLNPHFGAALCRAANDWNIDVWLDLDERLHSEVVVSAAAPEAAVAEIKRVGGHPKMDAVLIAGNPYGRPLGDALFEPIYKAASEMNLPISYHAFASDRPGGQALHAGGNIGYLEGAALFGEQAMHYISSLVTGGVFERYPDLKVVLKEFGVLWLPFVIWRLDESYDDLRFESPWVKQWPSEYIHDHIRVGTQPLEDSPDDHSSPGEILAQVDGMEDILIFCTDYPHSSMDDPGWLARRLPADWLPKVMFENACDTFGVPVSERHVSPAVEQVA
jgi:predicted TIM-barrel fold metal-dependent hydrolase